VLVVVLLASVVILVIAAGLLLGASTDAAIAANVSSAEAAREAAASAVHLAIADLTSADWNAVLAGAAASSFVDGPAGPRRLDDGSTVDLSQVLNLAACEHAAPCTPAEMDAVTADRPWGANNPRWRLFASGRLRDLAPPGAVASAFYIIAMVGDDPAENDGGPEVDGTAPLNPGAGVLFVRGEAFGPRGAHAVVEATVGRVSDRDGHMLPGLRLLTWRPGGS